MSQRVKRTQKDYTLAFKQAVVEQVERGEMTYKQAQSRYGIQGRSTVLKVVTSIWPSGLESRCHTAL